MGLSEKLVKVIFWPRVRKAKRIGEAGDRRDVREPRAGRLTAAGGRGSHDRRGEGRRREERPRRARDSIRTRGLRSPAHRGRSDSGMWIAVMPQQSHFGLPRFQVT